MGKQQSAVPHSYTSRKRSAKVYVASLDEDLKGEGAIFALDAKTGELQWRYPVRNSIKNTIAVDEGTVFAQDAEGYLYAINSQTGKLKWDK